MSSSPQTDAPRQIRLWPRTLTGGLIATAIALVAVVSLIVAVVTTLALRHFLVSRLDDQLDASTHGVQVAYSSESVIRSCLTNGEFHFVVAPGPDELAGSLDGPCRGVQVGRVDPDDQFSSSSISGADLAMLDGLQSGVPTTVPIAGAGDYRVLVLGQPGPRVVAGVSTHEVTDTISSLIGWEALVALLGVVVAAAAATIAVRRQLRPLHAVAATARNVARQPLDTGKVQPLAKVPDVADPQSEVGQVAGALNTMLAHVERAFGARHESEQRTRQFLADASHELRTPLATIQGYAELSRRPGASTEASLQHAMSKVEVESERMSGLVEDLLLLARLDSGRPLERSDVDVTRLVVEAVNDARVVDGDRHWRISIPDEPLAVQGDAQRLHQVLTNLLSNARRHTPPGTTVSVGVSSRADGGVDMTVHDDGPGLPESLRGHEFDRFSRGDSSRTRSSGGAGLGLSIVQAIVDAHGGTVRVESSPGSTVFAIALPHLAPTTSDASSESEAEAENAHDEAIQQQVDTPGKPVD
jgi:two-component system, OmpR family, sensor kinase